MRIQRRSITLLVFVVAFALLSNVAFGATVWQGNDRSYGSDSNHRVTICDGEADGRTAYSDYQTFAGNWFRVSDLNGSGNSCYPSDYRPSGISRHNTCENINNWPDACSGYSWH